MDYQRPVSTCVASQATFLQLRPSNSTNIAFLHTSAASTTIHTSQLQTDTMANESAEGPDSSISLVSGNLEVPVETEPSLKATANVRKRKAQTTPKTTAETAKRTRKTAADNSENKEDVVVGIAEIPRKKRTTTKVKYGEDTDDEVGSADRGEQTIVEKTVRKRAAQTKKSKEPVPPLEKRTIDTKLRIGAHVSVAGG